MCGFVFCILKQKNLRHSRTTSVRTEIKMQKWELSVSTNTSQFLKNEKKYHSYSIKTRYEKNGSSKSPIGRFVSVCTSPRVSVLFYYDVTRLCNKRHSCVPETRARE